MVFFQAKKSQAGTEQIPIKTKSNLRSFNNIFQVLKALSSPFPDSCVKSLRSNCITRHSTYLTERRDSARMTMVLARRTWAAAVTLLKATTRSWGFARAAACSPNVTLPEELFSTEPWQPENRILFSSLQSKIKYLDCWILWPHFM